MACGGRWGECEGTLGGRVWRRLDVAAPAAWRSEAQRRWYAGYDSYDTAMARATAAQRQAQAWAETYELARWWQLPCLT